MRPSITRDVYDTLLLVFLSGLVAVLRHFSSGNMRFALGIVLPFLVIVIIAAIIRIIGRIRS
jgi:uncharacterized membrane protein YdbT with pleckstrin-like domain